MLFEPSVVDIEMRYGLIIGMIGVLFGLVSGPGSSAVQAGQSEAAPFHVLPPAVPVPLPNDPLGVGCRDFRNRPVRTLDVAALGDVGRAEFIEGFPVIMLDPAVMEKLPASLQTFFILHECAHHVLGHLFAPTVESEKEADCWAIHEGRKRKTFSHDDVLAWKPHFAASLGSKMGHLPGPERVAFLLACFDET